jgi:hypothetical protein
MRDSLPSCSKGLARPVIHTELRGAQHAFDLRITAHRPDARRNAPVPDGNVWSARELRTCVVQPSQCRRRLRAAPRRWRAVSRSEGATIVFIESSGVSVHQLDLD